MNVDFGFHGLNSQVDLSISGDKAFTRSFEPFGIRRPKKLEELTAETEANRTETLGEALRVRIREKLDFERKSQLKAEILLS